MNADRAVLLISFPHQLPHALGALSQHQGCRASAPSLAPTLLVRSYAAREHSRGSQLLRAVRVLMDSYPSARLVFPGSLQRRVLLSSLMPVQWRAAILRRLLALPTGASDIYYSHDASEDRTAQALMRAYPAARRICFGDPPGFTYPAFNPNAGRVRTGIGLWLKKKLIHGNAQPLTADTHLVSIDIEAKGYATTNRELLSQVVARLRSSVCRAFTTDLQPAGSPPEYMLLTSNYAESMLCEPEAELAMYAELVARHVPPGAQLVIKPHCGTERRRVLQLAERLHGHRVRIVERDIQWLPVETLPGLHRGLTIVSTSSSSAMLRHIADANVIHALDTDCIRRYFRPQCIDYMLSANRHIQAYLQAASPDHATGSPPPRMAKCK